MGEFQQVLEGGVGAAAFYLLFTLVNIIKTLIGGKPKNGNTVCVEHGAMCVHLETIKADVGEIKGSMIQLVRDVAELQGRVEG